MKNTEEEDKTASVLLDSVKKLQKETKESEIQHRLNVELGKVLELDKPLEVQSTSKDIVVKTRTSSEDDPIGIDVSSLDDQNILSLEKALLGVNDTEIDKIMRRIESMSDTGEKPYASAVIHAFMKKINYDPRSL